MISLFVPHSAGTRLACAVIPSFSFVQVWFELTTRSASVNHCLLVLAIETKNHL